MTKTLSALILAAFAIGAQAQTAAPAKADAAKPAAAPAKAEAAKPAASAPAKKEEKKAEPAKK